MVLVKFHKIMEEVTHVAKDTKVSLGGKGSYKATSEDAVMNKIRPLMIAHGLVMVPETITHLEKTGSITTLGMSYRVTDVTDGDSIIISGIGQGSSSGDKGAGMAMTYAGKYALLKSLMIVTGDDPDQTGDVKHVERDNKNSDLANKIVEEIRLLISGKKLDPQTGASMIDYINKNKTDEGVLREAMNAITKLKER